MSSAIDPNKQIPTEPSNPDTRLKERLEAILAGAVDVLSLGAASIHLLNEQRDKLTETASVDSAGVRRDTFHAPLEVSEASKLRSMMDGRKKNLVAGEIVKSDDFHPDAVVPLSVGTEIIGMLSASSSEFAQAQDNLKSLGIFAQQAAYAVDAIRNEKKREQEARHERTLFEVSRAISSSLDTTQVLKLIAQQMALGVQCSKAAVYVWESDLGQLRRRADFGVTERAARKHSTISFTAGHPIAQALMKNEPVRLEEDVAEDIDVTLRNAIDGARGIAIPLISKDKLNAVALVACPEGVSKFHQEDIDLLMALAAQAAVAIENATLYDAQNRTVTELAALYAVSQALVASVNLHDRLQVVAESIAAVTGVSRCGVFLIEEGRASGQLLIGASPELKEEFKKLRLGLSERETAMMVAIKESKPTVIESNSSRKDAYLATKWKVKRLLAVPLIFEGRTVGLAAADEPDQAASFNPNAIQVAAAIGEQAAIAIQNSRLFEQTRKHAEDLGVLYEAGQSLSAELNVDEVLDTMIVQLKRLPLTDAASVMIRHWDGTLLIARDQGARSRYRNESYLKDPCDQLAWQAFLAEEVKVFRDIKRHHNCVHASLRKGEASLTSALCVPMIQRGEIIGVVSVHSNSNHEFTTQEIRLLGSLSSLSASAIARSQTYERERRIAETFQRSFLPDIGEKIGDYQIAHQYAAALDEARVGGDFYDVFQLGEDKLAFLIGDVSGKGLDAAVHTAMAKYLIRAYGYETHDPGKILERVNDALCFYVPSSLFVTLFCGVLHMKSGVMYYANAGHELPLLWSNSSGGFLTLACTGRALGFLPNCKYKTMETRIDPRDVLILYTDGISEARNDSGFFDIVGVREAARGVIGESANSIAEAIESKVKDFTGDRLRDDIALLVIRRRGE